MLGQSNAQVAEAVGLSPHTICSLRNAPLVVKKMQELDEAANQHVIEATIHIKEKALEASRLLTNVMEDEELPIALRLKAATDVLDRAGVVKVMKLEGKVAHGHFMPADIEAMKARVAGLQQVIEVSG